MKLRNMLEVETDFRGQKVQSGGVIDIPDDIAKKMLVHNKRAWAEADKSEAPKLKPKKDYSKGKGAGKSRILGMSDVKKE